MKTFALVLAGLIVSSFNLGMTQKDTLPPKYEVVGAYYGNGYTVMYPLGWSKSGSFAYIYQDMNVMGGAEIYKFNLVVQEHGNEVPLKELEVVYNLEYDSVRASIDSVYSHMEGDTTMFDASFFRSVYWTEYKDTVKSILGEYKIIREDRPFVYPLTKLTDVRIEIIENRKTDTDLVLQVDTFYEISLNFKDEQWVIYSKINEIIEDKDGVLDFLGNWTDLLTYTIEGCIYSSYQDKLFLYVHETTMGYEEGAERIILVPFSLNR